jgi:predicted ArsR family transcriptional regulator
MTTSRQKILVYLQKVRSASAREIARGLQMSAATVRHHLRVLVSDGRVELTSVRRREGRGRPEKVCSLPAAALGDNLSALSAALLTEAGTGVRMEALAKRLAGETNYAGYPLAKRLGLIVNQLKRMNYHARWEAGPQGPRTIFGHCPYAAIVDQHPELCQMDAALLARWMGQPAVQISRTGKEGSSVCVFAMGNRVPSLSKPIT